MTNVQSQAGDGRPDPKATINVVFTDDGIKVEVRYVEYDEIQVKRTQKARFYVGALSQVTQEIHNALTAMRATEKAQKGLGF